MGNRHRGASLRIGDLGTRPDQQRRVAPIWWKTRRRRRSPQQAPTESARVLRGFGDQKAIRLSGRVQHHLHHVSAAQATYREQHEMDILRECHIVEPRGLEPRHPPCKSGALPSELWPQVSGEGQAVSRWPGSASSPGRLARRSSHPPQPARVAAAPHPISTESLPIELSNNGARTGGRNRTRNTRIWKPSLYRIELRPQVCIARRRNSRPSRGGRAAVETVTASAVLPAHSHGAPCRRGDELDRRGGCSEVDRTGGLTHHLDPLSARSCGLVRTLEHPRPRRQSFYRAVSPGLPNATMGRRGAAAGDPPPDNQTRNTPTRPELPRPRVGWEWLARSGRRLVPSTCYTG